jgi:hypothetical protein
MAGIVVVTDSTASLPSEVVDKHGITVVPLQVVIGAEVYDEGDERPYPMSSLGDGYRHFHHLMPRFESGSPERRAELCAAWLEGTERFLGERAVEVQIYRRLRNLADRRADRSAPPELILRYRCIDRPGGGAGVADA